GSTSAGVIYLTRESVSRLVSNASNSHSTQAAVSSNADSQGKAESNRFGDLHNDSSAVPDHLDDVDFLESSNLDAPSSPSAETRAANQSPASATSLPASLDVYFYLREPRNAHPDADDYRARAEFMPDVGRPILLNY